MDWDDTPNHPLSDGDVLCMHYMMDIETHTVIYLRDLLATRAATDPHSTAGARIVRAAVEHLGRESSAYANNRAVHIGLPWAPRPGGLTWGIELA